MRIAKKNALILSEHFLQAAAMRGWHRLLIRRRMIGRLD